MDKLLATVKDDPRIQSHFAHVAFAMGEAQLSFARINEEQEQDYAR